MEDIIGLIIVGGMILFAFGLTAFGYVRSAKEKKVPQQETADEPIEREIHGRIVEKICRTVTRGTKSPRTEKEFYIDFETEDGAVTGYRVDEEIYFSVKENQTGTVLMVGERLYGFCPDEESSDG